MQRWNLYKDSYGRLAGIRLERHGKYVEYQEAESRIANLGANSEALLKRIGGLQKDNATKAARIAALEAEIKSLRDAAWRQLGRTCQGPRFARFGSPGEGSKP
jgi:hypothetical protein